MYKCVDIHKSDLNLSHHVILEHCIKRRLIVIVNVR